MASENSQLFDWEGARREEIIYVETLSDDLKAEKLTAHP